LEAKKSSDRNSSKPQKRNTNSRRISTIETRKVVDRGKKTDRYDRYRQEAKAGRRVQISKKDPRETRQQEESTLNLQLPISDAPRNLQKRQAEHSPRQADRRRAYFVPQQQGH
jgi:hypothetical protein